MSLSSDLLDIQELDLELARTDAALKGLPIIAEIAKKRATLAKLNATATKLLAARKDAEIAVADLDEGERACHEGVAAAQARTLDPNDRRQMHDLEVELSDFAKRLDKIAFDRPGAEQALTEAREREEQLNEYIKRFSDSILADAQSARDEAERLTATIEDLRARRAVIAGRLGAEMLDRYEKAARRFKGIAVERLEGRVPSVCRTALQTASMDELRNAGETAECPYCHRILVLGKVE